MSQVTTGRSSREIRPSCRASGSVRRCSNPTADWVSPSLAVTTARKNSSRSNRSFRTDPPGSTDAYRRVIIELIPSHFHPHEKICDESSDCEKKKIPLSSIGGHQHPHVVDGCGPEVLLGQTPKNKFGTAHFFPFDKCFIVVRLLHHVEKCVAFHLLIFWKFSVSI